MKTRKRQLKRKGLIWIWMVVMLSRIVNLNNLEKDTTKGHFNDLSSAYADEVIQAAAQASIVSGKGNGRFDPKSNATRAEAL